MAFLHVSFTLSPPPNAYVPGAYDMTTAADNMPTGLSTPGTAGQSMTQFAGQNNVGNIGQMYPLTTTQGTNQYTNTNQASSNNQPFFLLNPAFYEAVPGYLASTAGNLANFLITPPGYTPGGAPSAGGQSPYNPIMQASINKLALTDQALAQSMQNQYNVLIQQRKR